MTTVTRKEFICKSAAAVVGTSLLPQWLHAFSEHKAKRVGPIGFQSWTIREVLVNDFAGTLKMMAGLGYQHVEMCSPPGYANAGFGPLQSLKAKEMKTIMNDAGMNCYSFHYGFKELKENLQARMDFASEVGLTQMVISSFGLSDKATLDDWKKAADEANQLGEQSKKNGLQMVFHNHNQEFGKREGQIIYDVLLERLDPTLTKMQFQVWVIIDGFKAADYFRKHPGRFISAHLSDWSGVASEQVAIGKGKVDWKEFFEASKTGGLKNFYVEMDMPVLKESAAYLKTLKT